MDPLPLASQIADKIVRLRQEQGITSEQLAYKIGFSKSGLRYIERKMIDPRINSLAMIANGLGVPIVELFNHPQPGQGSRFQGRVEDSEKKR